MPNVALLSLPVEAFDRVISTRNDHGMDFDDAYQYTSTRIRDAGFVFLITIAIFGAFQLNTRLNKKTNSLM